MDSKKIIKHIEKSLNESGGESKNEIYVAIYNKKLYVVI